MTVTSTHVAVAWLREADWQRWQKIDRDLCAYDRWQKKINEAIQQIEHNGTRVVEKIVIDPDVFVVWCAENRKTVGTSSRAHYAAAELMRRHEAKACGRLPE